MLNSITLTVLTVLIMTRLPTLSARNGTWEVLVRNARISSMHTAVTWDNKVVLLDRRYDDKNTTRQFLRSALYDPATNTITELRGLMTNTWCSAAQFSQDGSLVQVGGGDSGSTRVRRLIISPKVNSSQRVKISQRSYKVTARQREYKWLEFQEQQVSLRMPRWYPSSQMLPDGHQIVVGGNATSTVEHIPPYRPDRGAIFLPLISQREPLSGRAVSLYPFLHLLPDGNLFVFAGTEGAVVDPHTTRTIYSLPRIPDRVPRTYPAGGASVLLPLSVPHSSADVIICGGSAPGAFAHAAGRNQMAVRSCHRITATAGASATWRTLMMPRGRTMGDMVLLPDGLVLILNGARRGSQGYDRATDAELAPVLFDPIRGTFVTQAASKVPRMYHSTANLLPDGRVIIAGSNTHNNYVLNAEFPTELRLEAFSPSYVAARRPEIVRVSSRHVKYGEMFEVTVSVARSGELQVNILSAPFSTHSLSMGQRLIHLTTQVVQNDGGRKLEGDADAGRRVTVRSVSLRCQSPRRAEVAPPGYYMAFVLLDGVPCKSATWIQLLQNSST